MFASQQGNGYDSWLITPYSTSNVWVASTYPNNSNCYYNTSNANGTRPSIYLKSNVVITGGSGTKSNPFTIALK